MATVTDNEPIANESLARIPTEDLVKADKPEDLGIDDPETIRLMRPLLHRRVEGKLPNAERDSNIFSKAFIFFVYPLLAKADKLDDKMTIEDIDLPHGIDSAVKARDRFIPYWEAEVAKNPENPSLAWALFKFLKALVALSTICGLFEAGGPFVSIVLMDFINDWLASYYPTIGVVGPSDNVTYIPGDTPVPVGGLFLRAAERDPLWHGGIMCVVFFVAQIIYTIGAAQRSRFVFHQEMRIEGALKMLMVERATSLSGQGQKDVGGHGAMFQLFSTDVGVIAGTLGEITGSGDILFSVAGAFIYLGFIVGWPCLVCLVILCIVIPFNYRIADSFIVYFIKKMEAADARTNKVVEIINAARVVKFYAWERPFRKIVGSLREPELQCVSMLMRQIAILLGSFSLAGPLMQIGLYIILIAATEKPTVVVFFQSLSIVQVLSLVMIRTPFVYSTWLQGQSSEKRIKKVLLAELRDDVKYKVHTDGEVGDVIVEDGCFQWPRPVWTDPPLPPGMAIEDLPQAIQDQINAAKKQFEDTPPEPAGISNINFKAKKGELVMVVGKVGAGKSSLCSAILSEMSVKSGKLTRIGKVAYVPQSAWILNATIRNNVLVNQPFDEEKYAKVLEAVDLSVDFKALPNGDLTEVGEKGINLSGGQKQRLSLARALYSDADIYVFDDPLSALDAHVGRHVFETAIQGMLADKTRILVTHQMAYLSQATRIYVAADMKIVEEKLPTEVTEKEQEGESTLMSMMRAFNATSNASASPKPETPAHMRKARAPSPMPDKEKKEQQGDGVLTAKEERQSGAVKNKTLFAYLGSFGSCWFWIGIFTLQTLIVCCNLFSQLWIGWWLEGKYPELNAKYPTSFFIGIYAGALVLSGCFTLARELVWRHGAVNAPRQLYDRMTDAVLHAPMSFFDTTPVGRIVNRFTRDAQQLDFQLPMAANQTIGLGFTFIGSAAAICYAVPWATPVFVVAIVCLMFIQPSVAIVILRRLSSAATGPVFALYSEALAGAVSIRCLQINDFCTERFALHIDERNGSFFFDKMAFEAIRARVNIIMAFVAALLMLVIMLSREQLDPTIVVFAINNSATVTMFMGYVLMQRGQLMMALNSIERMMEFTELQPEPSGDTPPPANWPSVGQIEFKNVSAQYREGLPHVLKDVSFAIKGGEKIGVVGRTGSGKSSLLLTIFRIIPLLGNSSIKIDGIDTKTIPLETLRSKVSAIPQEPVLFAGTVRTNLDPFFGEGMDEEEIKAAEDRLRNALELCHLKAPLEELRLRQVAQSRDSVHSTSALSEVETTLDILDVKLSDGDLSVGQKQLLCLARAVARNLKILVLDEATSSVDVHTDALIQQTIRTVFKSCTIITVAHRLNTIMDSDRILVLDGGTVAEFDTPDSLLSDPNGIFTSLAKQIPDEEAEDSEQQPGDDSTPLAFPSSATSTPKHSNVHTPKLEGREGHYSATPTPRTTVEEENSPELNSDPFLLTAPFTTNIRRQSSS